MKIATDDRAGSGMAMDLSVIAQLGGDKQTGLAIQRDTLLLQQLFCSSRRPDVARLRVLAFAAASDIGANMPIEFLLEHGDIDLAILYVLPGVPLPTPMPAHDVAIVIAPQSHDGEAALSAVDSIVSTWPCPILNRPAGIRNLERDLLYRRLQDVPGLCIPATRRVWRSELDMVVAGKSDLAGILPDGVFPSSSGRSARMPALD